MTDPERDQTELRTFMRREFQRIALAQKTEEAFAIEEAMTNYVCGLVEAAKAREEADGLFRTVLGWIVEDHPFLVHGYVQGHHALDPIHDLPVFLRAFPTVDYEGWVAKHGAAMDKLAASGTASGHDCWYRTRRLRRGRRRMTERCYLRGTTPLGLFNTVVGCLVGIVLVRHRDDQTKRTVRWSWKPASDFPKAPPPRIG